MFDHIPLILAQEVGAPPADRPPKLPEQFNTASDGQVQGSESGAPAPQRDSSPGGPGFGPLLPFILILAVFWFIMMGGQRREKKKRAKMLAALAKGNKVQTVGGIIGTVIEVRENDVVLKVDENTNVRIKFARSAIQSVVDEGTD